jgi:hypothetical protein
MYAERCSVRVKLRRSFFLLAALLLAECGASSAAPPTASNPAAQSSAIGNPDELLRQGASAVQAGQLEVGIEKYKAALDTVQLQDKRKRSAVELLLGIA